ncbi:bifunctional UDP-N-acetylglucosamine diphosphorylase/glucosamine-1-phosphate N-acetyltransferase GlmU [Wohlfahrtiimonas sp. G9077]|uniref:bifunctional UDP-N-acetylglucosamine diphosphorylase/glucosamine-1-phosphate N-acetyltransferase GlmU n=1 Tax=Wohlfahrtiimonas sp. G9077 TaxID=1980118 RepID=UPI000B9922B0|nr:bifunctional UDP-N-acetylglucosamine diphosphorylase/glucosamine-1-phosphate N-acetyltransferase GlmU [Wohlfahrtiimonas sp. G9077]OYQ73097.1 UDP-N-acetylglucosamine diphosphorylase/glucosamine-1-phosphate N-acetyltransferase [Wohlfahrtiimonas sp. G9077]
MKALSVVILAAGKGTRMKSNLPKPLHEIGGQPMLTHVLNTARALNPTQLIVIYGHEGEKLKAHYQDEQDITWVEQKTFLGTGDAMKYALPSILEDSNVLVLYADTPLIDQATLEKMLMNVDDQHVCWLTVEADQPFGYGRIVRDDAGNMMAIVEEKDASTDQKAITEINSGLFAASSKVLHATLPRLQNNNQQKEYYLTDVVTLAREDGIGIRTVSGDFTLIRGVNDRVQLSELEAIYQNERRKALMLSGVTLISPETVTIRGEIKLKGTDIIIEPNVTLEGVVSLGNNVHIGQGSVIQGAKLCDNVKVLPYSMIEHSLLYENVTIGPFARLRTNSILKADSKIGNFVETKNVTLGEGSKASHLTYLGDATIGRDVNIGAGTITCNYDGANKHQTIIEDNVFVGSNSSLVAPVEIKKGATIGAGSIISSTITEGALALTRATLRQVQNWRRPTKK